jgi:hypothetical protein
MPIAPSDLVDALVLQLIDLQRIRLKWIPFLIFRHLCDDLVVISKLAHFARAPGVQVALLVLM